MEMPASVSCLLVSAPVSCLPTSSQKSGLKMSSTSSTSGRNRGAFGETPPSSGGWACEMSKA